MLIRASRNVMSSARFHPKVIYLDIPVVIEKGRRMLARLSALLLATCSLAPLIGVAHAADPAPVRITVISDQDDDIYNARGGERPREGDHSLSGERAGGAERCRRLEHPQQACGSAGAGDAGL